MVMFSTKVKILKIRFIYSLNNLIFVQNLSSQANKGKQTLFTLLMNIHHAESGGSVVAPAVRAKKSVFLSTKQLIKIEIHV
jgi:hypothetical protein